MTTNMPHRHSAALAAVAIRVIRDLPQLPITVIASDLGISTETINQHWRKLYPGTALRVKRGAITDEMRARRIEPFAEFCDFMIDLLVGEMTSTELFAATEAAWGNAAARGPSEMAGKRRMFRALRRLIDTRRVSMTGKPCSGAVYRALRFEGVTP